MKKLIILSDFLEAINEYDDTIHTYIIVDEANFEALTNDLKDEIQNYNDDENMYERLLKIVNKHNAYTVKPEKINY